MNTQQKNEIKELLDQYVQRFDSQKKAFNTIQGASEATLINMRKDKWDSIKDEMWRNVGSQLGYSIKGEWQNVETRDFKTLTALFDDAKHYNNVFGIVATSGSGKTHTSKWFKNNQRNVFHIVCAEYYNRKVFLSKLLTQMGKDNSGSANEMMDTIVESMLQLDSPLIILDEADKLNDTVLYFFITLYNQLQGKCGIILLATDFLEKRIRKGVRLKRKGYEEIFSRLGRKFITLPGTTNKEVEAICSSNGITDPMLTQEIVNTYEGDLRRVERAIHREKMRQQAA